MYDQVAACWTVKMAIRGTYIAVGFRPGKAGPMYDQVAACWTVKMAIRGTYIGVGFRPGLRPPAECEHPEFSEQLCDRSIGHGAVPGDTAGGTCTFGPVELR
jgi:hypothetical protein